MTDRKSRWQFSVCCRLLGSSTKAMTQQLVPNCTCLQFIFIPCAAQVCMTDLHASRCTCVMCNVPESSGTAPAVGWPAAGECLAETARLCLCPAQAASKIVHLHMDDVLSPLKCNRRGYDALVLCVYRPHCVKRCAVGPCTSDVDLAHPGPGGAHQDCRHQKWK